MWEILPSLLSFMRRDLFLEAHSALSISCTAGVQRYNKYWPRGQMESGNPVIRVLSYCNAVMLFCISVIHCLNVRSVRINIKDALSSSSSLARKLTYLRQVITSSGHI